MFRLIRHLRFSSSNIRDRIRQQRQSRLNKGADARTLTTVTMDDLHKIRNIGIIAHIDAGKTTTTERMLYYAGALPSPGNIDEGTTAMDYLAQQRQRGITIRSAAISFNWKQFQLNLIDTPGHVDFSAEVTRSLQVLDGVVTILDAVKGVESQTQKVWAHASKNNLPKICYLNKMDRIGSAVGLCMESIQKKLKAQPILLQQPIGDGDSFKGVVDLITLQEITFGGKYGQQLIKTKNCQKHIKAQSLLRTKKKIMQQLADYDDFAADAFLNQRLLTNQQIKKTLRKIMISEKGKMICPVLVGSSYKNIGVQPLMDSIVSYLPSPSDRGPVKSYNLSNSSFNTNAQFIQRKASKNQPFTAYVFKVLFDIEKGPLAYTRIYSGSLDRHSDIYNSSRQTSQKVGQILRVRANQYVPIHHIGTGDIVAFSGLSQTSAGDTLTLGNDQFCLPKLDIPTPVFTAPFEVESNKYFREFDNAMHKAITEDNSLTYKYEAETNQYLVSGMGELHLQILRDRLISQKIPVKMGNLKINFKQTVSQTQQQQLAIKNQIKPQVFQQFNITLEISPLRSEEAKVENRNQILLRFDRINEFDVNWNQFLARKQYKLKGQSQSLNKSQAHRLKKTVRNPTPVQPIYSQTDQIQDDQQDQSKSSHLQQKSDQQQLYYHINTLPFQTLYQLVQTIQTSSLYGKNNLPAVGIQIKIIDGKYKKSSFSKSVMNRCTSSLVRKLIQKNSVLIEPILQFTLTGQNQLIDMALKDVLRKRGRIVEQEQNTLNGFIPAEGVRGWIKELRSMGVEVEFKFADYQEVVGISPDKLLEMNM